MKKFASYLFAAILGGLIFAFTFNYYNDYKKSSAMQEVDSLPVVQANFPATTDGYYRSGFC